MKMPKSLDNLFNNIYFLYFVAFLAVFNVFAYIIMNNFNAIILFILVGYITYLFSKNMAIVLLVALLLTNLFMSSKNNRMGREGFQEGVDASGNPTDSSGNTTDSSGNNTDSSGNTTDGSGNHVVAQKLATAIQNRRVAQTPGSMNNNTTSVSGMQNMQSVDLDKMQSLLNQSQKLMGDLKNAFPGMSNILGNLGQ
jgi:hypothetical protein